AVVQISGFCLVAILRAALFDSRTVAAPQSDGGGLSCASGGPGGGSFSRSATSLPCHCPVRLPGSEGQADDRPASSQGADHYLRRRAQEQLRAEVAPRKAAHSRHHLSLQRGCRDAAALLVVSHQGRRGGPGAESAA